MKADELYCAVCEINFTSKQHSEQHYQGRNHARKAAGLNPLKSGYINQHTGKWQRHPPSAGPGTRSGLVADGGCVMQLAGDELAEPTGQPRVKKTVPEATAKRFFCQICKVAATSQQQFDMHLQGKAHKARSATGQATPSKKPAATPIVKKPVTPGEASANVIKNKLTKSPEDRDYSQFRTPSGLYYCASCNLSLNSENQFVQHIGSKKHRSKQLQRLPRDAHGGRGGRGGAGARGRGKGIGFAKI